MDHVKDRLQCIHGRKGGRSRWGVFMDGILFTEDVHIERKVQGEGDGVERR